MSSEAEHSAESESGAADPANKPASKLMGGQRVQEARQKAEFILSRIYGLFRAPNAEWEQIRDEETNIPSILIGFVAPLAAVPPVCDLIGSAIFGHLLQGDVGGAIVRAAVYFVASIVLVFLLGLMINAAAENFDADRDDLKAQKVAAYALAPTFLSGLFSLWPPILWVSFLSIGYSAYLIYRGLPVLMKAPEDRALGYAATVAASGLVAIVILFGLASCVT